MKEEELLSKIDTLLRIKYEICRKLEQGDAEIMCELIDNELEYVTDNVKTLSK